MSRFVSSNMFKPSINFLTYCSKAALLLWTLFVICVSCLSVILSYLFLAILWSPAVKGLTSWLIFCVKKLPLSHMVSWVRSGNCIDSWSCLLPYFVSLSKTNFSPLCSTGSNQVKHLLKIWLWLKGVIAPRYIRFAMIKTETEIHLLIKINRLKTIQLTELFLAYCLKWFSLYTLVYDILSRCEVGPGFFCHQHAIKTSSRGPIASQGGPCQYF